MSISPVPGMGLPRHEEYRIEPSQEKPAGRSILRIETDADSNEPSLLGAREAGELEGENGEWRGANVASGSGDIGGVRGEMRTRPMPEKLSPTLPRGRGLRDGEEVKGGDSIEERKETVSSREVDFSLSASTPLLERIDVASQSGDIFEPTEDGRPRVPNYRTMPEQLPPEGWRSWCRGKAATVVKASAAASVLCASVAVHAVQLNPLSNVISSVGIGIGFQSLVNCAVKNKYSPRVEQVALTVFGQASLYGVSQVWGHTLVIPLQLACVSSIGVMLGVGLAMYGKKLYEKRGVLRSESISPQPSTGVTFEGAFLPRSFEYLKVAASASCAVAWYFASQTTDPVLVGLASWGALYYAADFLGQKICQFTETKIAAEIKVVSRKAFSGLTQLARSKYRTFKTGVNTLGFFAVPLCWIPWKAEPRTPERCKELWLVGMITGLFDGFMFRSQENRFRNIPIDQLDELQPRPPVQSSWFRAWKIGWPSVAFLGFTAYIIHELVTLEEDTDKGSTASLYAAALWTCGKDFLLERYWDLEKRIRQKTPNTLWKRITEKGGSCCEKIQKIMKDRAIIGQSLPRFLGVRPLYLYFLTSQCIFMHTGQTDLPTPYKVLNMVGWFFYGKSMVNEFQQTWGERKGTVFSLAMMMMMNALFTLQPAAKQNVIHTDP